MELQVILFPLLSRRGQGWSDRANFCFCCRSCVLALASVYACVQTPSGSPYFGGELVTCVNRIVVITATGTTGINHQRACLSRHCEATRIDPV